ncbi:MAG: hypothetical protein ABSF80_02615 [Chitinispirillaceae bacterium]
MKKHFSFRHIPYGLLYGILFSGFGFFLASCTGGSALRFNKLAGTTEKDDYLSAISSIQRNCSKWYGKTNEFLYCMDIGVLYHYAARYDSSAVYLQRAAEVYDGLFARSVTNEAASLLINDNVRPYRSRPYELVMLHQFNALNYLARGNTDDALVETRAVQLLFNEWERTDRHDQTYSNDAMFHYLSSMAYDAAGDYDDAMISLYKAVETYNRGPVALPPAVKNYAYYMLNLNDRGQDTSVLGISADVPSEKVPGLQNGLSEIVLVGYAGKGPALVEEKWWGTYIRGGMLIINHTDARGAVETFTMPAPPLPEEEYEKASEGQKTDLGTTFHISFSLPRIRTFNSMTGYFTVRGMAGNAPEAPETSVVINDLDRQLAKNLEDTRTATMIRTVIRTTLRTITAQKAKDKMKSSSAIGNLLLNLGTDVLADQLEHADTRTCFLVPKTVQIARIPVQPGTYTLEAAAHSETGAVIGKKTFENIQVKQGEKKILFYCSFR